jgi:hypothetical protein
MCKHTAFMAAIIGTALGGFVAYRLGAPTVSR